MELWWGDQPLERAMQINYKYHEDLSVQKVDKILDQLKQQG